MNIYKEQDKNVGKTWLLMAVFFALIVAVGYAISYIYGEPLILYVAIVLSIVMNIGSYWFSDKIVLSMYRAKPVTREQYPDLWNVTENLSITAGLPMPRLYIISDPQPNAFATGRNRAHAAVAVTTGLLSILDRTELEGVIAHELSHIGNRDILLSTVIAILVGLLSILADIFLRSSFHRGSGDRGRAGGVLMILGIILIILSPIVATVIQLAVSRKREFLADASGALLTRYPEGLASALEKISRSPMPMQKANNATAHLFISNPFGVKALSGMHKLFMTHPPAEERIAILRGMKDR